MERMSARAHRLECNGAVVEVVPGLSRVPRDLVAKQSHVVTDDDTGSGATKYLGLTPGMVLHKVMDRLWEGCCPDLLLPIRLVR